MDIFFVVVDEDENRKVFFIRYLLRVDNIRMVVYVIYEEESSMMA